eukprot:358656-Chlamydomonas_euryale.AAC.1
MIFSHAQSSAPVSVTVHPAEEAPFTVHRSATLFTLDLPDAMNSTPSAATSQWAPTTRPRPGSTALPGYRSHTRKGLPLLPWQAQDRVACPSNWGFLHSNGAIVLIASRQACLSNAHSATSSRIFGQGIN